LHSIWTPRTFRAAGESWTSSPLDDIGVDRTSSG
jgi:hypothetical protein